MYNNSIYKALKDAAGADPRKQAIAYVYSLVKGRDRRIISKDVLADEGSNVYVGIDTIGRHTLQNFEENYLDMIKSRLSSNSYTPLEGTVEETVLSLFKRYDFEESLGKIGEELHSLLSKKPSFEKSLDELTAGFIQRYEQRAIKEALSKHL